MSFSNIAKMILEVPTNLFEVISQHNVKRAPSLEGAIRLDPAISMLCGPTKDPMQYILDRNDLRCNVRLVEQLRWLLLVDLSGVHNLISSQLAPFPCTSGSFSRVALKAAWEAAPGSTESDSLLLSRPLSFEAHRLACASSFAFRASVGDLNP
jgi:hypothetical protein